jgi:hemerythrin-like metal-binding protein
MAEIVWSPTLSVGIEQFDDDHRQLIACINELGGGPSGEPEPVVVRAILERLDGYTKTHFAHEEALLQQYGYPGLVAHKREHDFLATRVQNLRDAFDAGDASAPGEIHDLLADWLNYHILHTDKAYAAFLTERGAS